MRDYEQTVRELRDPRFVYHFSRDYLKNMMDDAADAIEELCELVDNNKTAVKHGRWVPVTNGRGGFECSICYSYAPSYQDGVEWLSLYCPNCGAKMDLGGHQKGGRG